MQAFECLAIKCGVCSMHGMWNYLLWNAGRCHGLVLVTSWMNSYLNYPFHLAVMQASDACNMLYGLLYLQALLSPISSGNHNDRRPSGQVRSFPVLICTVHTLPVVFCLLYAYIMHDAESRRSCISVIT